MGEAPPAADTSPLIHLARIDKLTLLTVLGPTLVVPASVLEEIEAKGPDDIPSRTIRQAAWLTHVPGPDVPNEIEAWDLGRGESSVLAWGRAHPGALTVLDDGRARRCARELGIPVIGTAGIVVRAKRQGWIPAVRPVMESLIEAGMYLSDAVLREALARVGEE